ncbi:MAG: phosphatase PAP2 family protein [Ilumatobacteraceae bacterium]
MSVVADKPTLDHRVALGAVVPVDVWRIVRLAAMGFYVVIMLWWFRTQGMVWERISVAVALGVFLLCAFIGKPLREWGRLAFDVSFYCAMWYAYETTRGAADGKIFGIKFPLQVDSVRNIDRVMFFGNDPNTVLQSHFWESSIRWYDKVASTTYMTHFFLAPIVMGALWATNHRQFRRFLKRFATVLGVGCLMFIVMPTAPPWMAAKNYHIIDPIVRNSSRGFSAMGFKAFTHGWQNSLDWGNAVAAMPSLHASFALIVPAFFLPWLKPLWLKAVVLVFPVVMLASLVYLGEHWVIDGLIGWALVGGSFWSWNFFERRQRRNRAQRSYAALAAL